MENTGYPSIVYFLVLVIGLAACLWKAEVGLLFGLALLGGLESTRAVYTRIAVAGPYCNLLDINIIIVAISAICLFRQNKTKFTVPPRILCMAAILFIGFFRSVQVWGYEYQVIRALRWAVNFPLLFTIGTLIPWDARRIRVVIHALYIGAVAACAAYLVRVCCMRKDIVGSYLNMRDCQFSTSPALALFVASVFMPNFRAFRGHGLLHGVAAILATVAMIMSQTRSIYASVVPSFMAAGPFIRVRRMRPRVTVLRCAILLLGIASGLAILSIALPSVDIKDLAISRMMDIGLSAEGRKASLYGEYGDWCSGSFFLGRGLWYYGDAKPDGYAHLGWLTLLSQLGATGLCCYLYTVSKALIDCRKIVLSGGSDAEVLLAQIVGVWLVICSIMFVMSGSFLFNSVVVPAFLAGMTSRVHRVVL